MLCISKSYAEDGVQVLLFQILARAVLAGGLKSSQVAQTNRRQEWENLQVDNTYAAA